MLTAKYNDDNAIMLALNKKPEFLKLIFDTINNLADEKEKSNLLREMLTVKCYDKRHF